MTRSQPLKSPPGDAAAEEQRRGSLPVRLSAASAERRQFFRAPQTASAAVAAVLEPALHVATLYGAHLAVGAVFDRMAVMLTLLVILLTFPGTDRFREAPLHSLAGVVGNSLWMFALVIMCGYVTSSLGDFDAQAIQLWAVATPVVQLAAVWVGGAFLRSHLRTERARRRAVVVGGGELGIDAARVLAARRHAPIQVAGYFDDRQGARLHAIALGQRLGRLDEVARYVDKLGICEVYITLPMASQPRIVALIDALRQTTASIFFVPDVFSIDIVQGRLQDLGGMPVVGICETPFTGINAMVKRASDLLMASAVLLLTAPLMAAIALSIKLDSRGPVIFKQRRSGLDGQEIMVWKFRTLHTPPPAAPVRQATADDRQLTRLGVWLRRSGLDQLPQFFNVLQGRMSVVGPRPHAVAHNTQYRAIIKGYMVRHKARPGITGWAQVNGFRGETDSVERLRDRVECDLAYLRNWSLGLDLAIIARTLRLVLRQPQAG